MKRKQRRNFNLR